jgi:hypothetical protein
MSGRALILRTICRICIAISTTSSGGTSLLRVVNIGELAPLDQVDRLFLPFTRYDDRP